MRNLLMSSTTVSTLSSVRDRLHQPIVRNRGETVRDVRLHHPPATPPGLINSDLERVIRGPLRAEPETARREVRLEDRLEHDLQRGLHNPVPNRREGGFILRSFPGVAR